MQKQIKDEYEIIAEIGIGGMATVYKAVQKSLDRLVAIKELKKSFHADGQIVKRFERESRVAASLQHENIVHIYDYWKRPDYAIVMEYVDGTTLAGVIEKTGALPVDVGIMIAVQVAAALDYAHMCGLVHRDIKPSNIMIKRNGEVKLMDFGIAQGRNHESLTAPGTLIGTPSYMSPEQILGQPLDVRSDIFSFGVVLYEMFTGAKPFLDDDARPVTAKIVKDPFPSPRRVNPEIPRRLQRLIKKCLRKKPARRYEAMPAVRRKLERDLRSGTTKASSLRRISEYLVSRNVFEAMPDQETLVAPVVRTTTGRMRAALISVAVLTLLAAGSAAVYYYGFPVRQQAVQLSVNPSAAPQPFSGTTPSQTPDSRGGGAGSPQPATRPSPARAAAAVEKPDEAGGEFATKATRSATAKGAAANRSLHRAADHTGKKKTGKKKKKIRE